MVDKLEKAKVIRPYNLYFGSGYTAALIRNFSRRNSARKNSGVFKLGHRGKSIIWHWKFDVDRRYFHEFRTFDYEAAIEFYEAKRFSMWKEDNGDTEEQNEGKCSGGTSTHNLFVA